MMPSIIANVNEVVTGDDGLLADVDVNIVKDDLNLILDDDINMQILLDNGVGHGGYYGQISQKVADNLNTLIGTLSVRRTQVMVPAWNSLRLASMESAYVRDDFLTVGGDYLWYTITGTGYSGGSSVHIEGAAEHPGQFQINTGTTANTKRGIEFSDSLVAGNLDMATFTVAPLTTLLNTRMRVG